MRKFFLTILLIAGFFIGIFYIFQADFFNFKDRKLINEQKITKRPLDEKEYKFVKLKNGLQILLIHDQKAKLSAVSLSVASGSTSEPDEIHGLAHYLEHMLFLGSEKYPKADSFMEFVSQNGGSYNAYTAKDETNFFFSINPVALDQALSRFSDFFIAPLLTEEFMEREQQAVHAEFTSKLQNDPRRALDALSEVLNQKNPMSHFSAGNNQTLIINPNLRPALVKFFEQNYFASNMSLVVLTPDSLQETKSMLEKHFEIIKDGEKQDLPKEEFFSKDFLPAKLEVQSLKQEYKLQLYFPTKNPDGHYREKPDAYLDHIISYAGDSSLVDILKKQGWILSLGASNSFTYEDKALFAIYLELTKEGFENLDKVKEVIFSYIDLIKKDGINQWRFDELKEIVKNHWDYDEGEDALDLVTYLASKMKKVAPKDILINDFLFEKYNPDLIKEFLEQISLQNMFEIILAPETKTDKISKWLKAPYKITNLDLKSLNEKSTQLKKDEQIENLISSLKLPEKNPYLTEQKIITKEEQAPVEFFDSENLQIFSGENSSFKTPKIYYRFKFESKLAYKNTKNKALNGLLKQWLKDATYNTIYVAYNANLKAQIGTVADGLIIGIDGLSASASQLLSIILYELKQGEISPQKFKILKAKLIRDWENKKYQALSQQMLEKFNQEIRPPKFEYKELIENLKKIKINDLEKYRREFLLSAKITAFLYGNINSNTNTDIKNKLEAFIHKGTKAQTSENITKILQSGEVFNLDLKIENPDRGFIYYIQAPNSNLENRAKFALLTQLQSAEFFYQLRTLQQLGYIVTNINKPLPKAAGFLFFVQSPNAELTHIHKSIQDFLKTDQNRLNNLSETDFQVFKAGLINLLEKPDDSLNSLARRFWLAITNKEGAVDLRPQIIKALEPITLQDMQNFYSDILAHKYGEMVFTAGGQALDE